MMSAALEFAAEIARQAGKLVLDFSERPDLEVSLKADKSVVTAADLAAERWITQAIHAQFPGEPIISEELSQVNPPVAGAQNNNPDSIWIIDPLDGTTNYSLGLPVWGIIITRLQTGWPCLAAIYFPRLDELYTVERGTGAFLNGAPIRTLEPERNKPLSVFACCARTYRRYNVKVPYKTRIYGSAAYSFCMVSRGAALVAFEATPKIWDIAGPWLLVEEAGGAIEALFGPQPFPFQPMPGCEQVYYPTLAAVKPEIQAQSRQQILPRLPVNRAIGSGSN